MTKKTDDDKLDFMLETVQVAEVVDEAADWTGDGITTIASEALAEMTKGDEKPFFIDFTALYEGVSGNNRDYTKDAVESCVQAMVGVNMYKGHEEPGTSSWKYREPVGRVVAAKNSQIVVDGRRVLAAKGKAYITQADPKLRSDIVSKMAGPLSILGNARAVREIGSAKRTITRIHKPLKSIDFCNPGTNGMAHAGVTAVVREMSEDDQTHQKPDPQGTPEMTKLTIEQLKAEYGAEIRALVSEQLDDQLQEITAEKTKLTEAQSKFDSDKKEFETTIAEQKAEIEDLTKKNGELETEIAEQKKAAMKADLNAFAAEHVAEMRGSDDHEENIVEMAADGLEPALVDDDLEKSKNLFKDKLAKQIERTEKLAESLGGGTREADDRTRSHKGNPPKGKKKGPDINKFLSPELVGDKD